MSVPNPNYTHPNYNYIPGQHPGLATWQMYQPQHCHQTFSPRHTHAVQTPPHTNFQGFQFNPGLGTPQPGNAFAQQQYQQQQQQQRSATVAYPPQPVQHNSSWGTYFSPGAPGYGYNGYYGS